MDNARNHLRRVQQGLGSQVSVSLGHPGLGVPKKSLDHVKRDPLVHQEAGERMAQIMQSDVSQARTALVNDRRRSNTSRAGGASLDDRRTSGKIWPWSSND